MAAGDYQVVIDEVYEEVVHQRNWETAEGLP